MYEPHEGWSLSPRAPSVTLHQHHFSNFLGLLTGLCPATAEFTTPVNYLTCCGPTERTAAPVTWNRSQENSWKASTKVRRRWGMWHQMWCRLASREATAPTWKRRQYEREFIWISLKRTIEELKVYIYKGEKQSFCSVTDRGQLPKWCSDCIKFKTRDLRL